MSKQLPREVYFDINVSNTELTGTELMPLRFSESRQSALVENASDYSLSIVRFQLDTYSLPSYIANIENFPNTNPNKMIETVTLEYNGTVVGPLNLTWIPTNLHVPQPANLSAVSPRQAKSEYYYGNCFRHYCDLVNNALSTLTTELKTAVGVTLNNLLQPKLIWNDDNQTASVIGQELFYNDERANYVKIYFDRALYARFTSLPALKNFNNTLGRIYRIYMKSDYSNKIITLDPLLTSSLQNFIKTNQEYSTISNWSPLSSICFTTANIPVVPTQLSEPVSYSNGTYYRNSSSKFQESIITDMATNDMVYKPNLIYVPSAEYRYIDMVGNNPITDVNINVFWRDKEGILYPFYLQSGGSCSIKLLFKLKKKTIK